MSSEASQPGHVLYPIEAEAFVQELAHFKISAIGSEKWTRQRERLEQLTLQAVYNASRQADEFVKEYLVTHEKLGVLVHELLSLELWREKIFPLMMETSAHPTSGFPAYLVLYTEGTIASLLETALFYQECCESCGEAVLDLVDYCQRRLVALLAEGEGPGGGGGVVEEVREEGSDSEDENNEEKRRQIFKELKEQSRTLTFSITIKTISMLQYITDHLDVLPLSVSTRLLNTHNLPCLLVNLLDYRPWIRTSEKGVRERYEDGVWHEAGDTAKLTKTEGQIWITLYKLLMDKDCQQRYEFTSASRLTILQLRKHMSAPLLEQIPQLGDMHRYLEQLALMDPPAAHRDLIIEQVPVIYEKLIKSNSKKWGSIAKEHAKLLLEPTPSQLQAAAQHWTSSSHLELLEGLVSGPPKCAVCGEEATKRCSRCRNEWYCGRKCQVSQWKKHKPACDIIANSAH